MRGPRVFRGKGDFDIDDQPPVHRIPRANLASVSRDSAVRNCKAKSRSFVLSSVCCLDTAEGQKYLLEHGFRHARPQISNSDDSAVTFAADRHVDGSSLASEANAITDDILDGAAEQFFGAGHRAFVRGGNADTPGLRTGFEVRIGDDFVNKSRQVDG